VLTLLRISGFALIDELELPLGAGLTAITGETGAGKSIIVEALGLLRGVRASAELIRAGAEEARVEAIVELPPQSEVRGRLEAEGRDAAEGLLVRRSLNRSGRGRVHLGGSLATAADLTATVGRLIDIASQHDQQSLTDPESQLAILDAFAENESLRAEMTAAHSALVEARAALEAFDADARTRAQREDLLRFQLGELEAARPMAGEYESLRGERERLKGAETFFAAAARGEEILYAQEGAAVGQLAAVSRDLLPLSALDPTLAPLVERLQGARATVEDVARDLGRYAAGIRADPARLAEVEERLYLLGRLSRKHGGTLSDVIDRWQSMKRELGEIASFEEGLALRREAVARAEAQAQAAAAALTASRQRAAGGLEKKVNATLRELALGNARLPVQIETRPAIGPTGADKVQFLFAPNPGDPPRPLAKIASGGELSRVMLAVKQALAKTDQVLTYVFDEVDAGVGGGAAETIGRKLQKISEDRQVLVITHLPQIAAFADAHVRVVKTAEKGRTRVAIEAVIGKERTAEIARMLGGVPPSAEATAHADQMLRRARP
jgi:DNA repair protein RecN (Recombination protein N)